MEHQDIINGLERFKTRLLDDVAIAYRDRGNAYGLERFHSWQKLFSTFLDENLPGESKRLNARLYKLAVGAKRNEPPAQRFWRDYGNIATAFIDSLIIDLHNNEYHVTTPERKSTENEDNATASIASKKPRIFIGSSTEGLSVARLLQTEMDYDAEVTLWSQGVFGLSGGTLESLVKKAPEFDFAVLVLTPDDVVIKQETTRNVPRDNVLFELGLFIGILGRERTYIVHPRVDMNLPSDLAGITLATYDANRSDRNTRAALGPAVTQILTEVKQLGRRMGLQMATTYPKQ